MSRCGQRSAGVACPRLAGPHRHQQRRGPVGVQRGPSSTSRRQELPRYGATPGKFRDDAGDKREQRSAPAPGKFGSMKKLVELIVCLFHPIAVVLLWIDLVSRRDMRGGPKLAWAIFGLIPLVPFLYVLAGGDLW